MRDSAPTPISPWLKAMSLALLLSVCLLSCGGISRLFYSTYHCAHKVTSLALMRGQLSYPRPLLAGIEYDMEVFNGASFTTWGYGVPLLQIPFHFFYRLSGNGLFFPDRFIFFIYLSAAVGLLWSSLSALVGVRYRVSPSLRACSAATCLSLFLVTFGLLWLVSVRFAVWEETISYLIVSQLAVLGCYIHYRLGGNSRWVWAAGFLAGLGVLIRGTALCHLTVWAGCFFGSERNSKALRRFSIAAMPCLLFWFFSNYAKSGELLSLGLQNSLPGLGYQYLSARFHSACFDSWSGAKDLAVQVFWALFLGRRELSAHLLQCHFLVEERGAIAVPFLGPVILFALIGLFLYSVRYGRRRPEVFLPYGGILVLFLAYVQGGTAMTYRYAGDFWPLILLVFAQFLLFNEFAKRAWIVPVSLLLAYPCLWKINNVVIPQLRSLVTTQEPDLLCAASLGKEATRLNSLRLPSRIGCKDRVEPLAHNKQGWIEDSCRTEEVTNLFLGIPQKAESSYRLRLSVERPLASQYRVYINGKYYTAKWDGEVYAANFSLPLSRMASPNIVVTIQWSKSYGITDSKLLAVDVI